MVRREDEPDEEGSYKPISEHFPNGGKPFPPAPIAAASAGKGCQVRAEEREEKTPYMTCV